MSAHDSVPNPPVDDLPWPPETLEGVLSELRLAVEERFNQPAHSFRFQHALCTLIRIFTAEYRAGRRNDPILKFLARSIRDNWRSSRDDSQRTVRAAIDLLELRIEELRLPPWKR